MEDCRPEYVDRVATDMPDLKIVIQHGGWPYVHEAIGVLYKQPNVFMVPGQYIHYDFPGSAEYIAALRRQCSEQIIFGSVFFWPKSVSEAYKGGLGRNSGPPGRVPKRSAFNNFKLGATTRD